MPIWTQFFAPLRGLAQLSVIEVDQVDDQRAYYFGPHSWAATIQAIRTIWPGKARFILDDLPAHIYSNFTTIDIGLPLKDFPPSQWTTEQLHYFLPKIRDDCRGIFPAQATEKLKSILAGGLDLAAVYRRRPLLLNLVEILPTVGFIKQVFFEPLIDDPEQPGKLMTPIQATLKKVPTFRASDYDTLWATVMISGAMDEMNAIRTLEYLKTNAAAIAEAAQDPDLVGGSAVPDFTGALPHQRRYNTHALLMEYLLTVENIFPDDNLFRAQLHRPYCLGLILARRPELLRSFDPQNERIVFAAVTPALVQTQLSLSYKSLELIEKLLDLVDADPKLLPFVHHRSVKDMLGQILPQVYYGREDQFGENQLRIWKRLIELTKAPELPCADLTVL